MSPILVCDVEKPSRNEVGRPKTRKPCMITSAMWLTILGKKHQKVSQSQTTLENPFSRSWIAISGRKYHRFGAHAQHFFRGFRGHHALPWRFGVHHECHIWGWVPARHEPLIFFWGSGSDNPWGNPGISIRVWKMTWFQYPAPVPGVFFNARCWLVFDVGGTRKTVVCLKISWMLQNSFAAQAPRLAVWPGMGLRGFDSWCYFPEDFPLVVYQRAI